MAVVALAGGGAAAQEPGGGPDALRPSASAPVAEPGRAALDLRDRFMYFDGPFAGSISQNGRRVELGPFGRHVDRHFQDSPEALEAARSFRLLTRVGAPLYIVGVAALITDLALLSANLDSGAFPSSHQPLVLGLALGGAALGVTGSILIAVGGYRLRSAVNRFNAFLINRVLPAGNQLDLRLFSDRGGAGAALQLRF
jgi:hypothetical protein